MSGQADVCGIANAKGGGPCTLQPFHDLPHKHEPAAMSEVTDESARGIEAQIADMLAAHVPELRITNGEDDGENAPEDYYERICTCGLQLPFTGYRFAHRAHLAAALAPLIATAQADAWDLLASEVNATAEPLKRGIDWRSENPWNPANWTTPEAGLRHAQELRARADRVEGGQR